ncbi:hypothetical protein RJZ56_006630 [Blastomyces dermatitidis]|uniref:DUF887 domain-containing protein n=3 Tax=Blastomyces TaxID=229219 RepID=A0A179UTX6_BLAGS|nr:DUF887 domain-containing protein [Blastomyces gilchristii SLH14081]XP_045272023.1 uncharacterized protein BDCG_00745 [Blastomyces dermatitidis ER-3]EGE83441.1 DUF887 domain-containing protein [Blastomyces dermatitidis ATCC 18188]EQL36295.1 hypothetical protein BDFG_02256 [Blastomyces dermatitidis ATCC 26199]EEQ83940.1 hypothetical protein BDCG_00745 [Blastomyces dermatitidis ER-3]OAT10481.1 DUF887 domain-containing protein [Blastomyces gilchristii SLH14081]
MLDPIPPPPQWLQDAFRPVAEKLGLHAMTLHIHEVIFFFVFYQLIQSVVSPILSNALFPKFYPHFNRRTKLNWDVHVVSLIQSSLINAVALWVMYADKERQAMTASERVWGYSGTCGLIQAMAVGYFIWDLIVSTRYIGVFGIGLWFHAVSALWVYSLGFRPFVNYYAPTFILYELSSPFLNFHWFFDKVNMTGSKAQWYNGMALLSVFFCCRLAWGTWQSFRVFVDIFTVYSQARGNSTWNPPDGHVSAGAEVSKFADTTMAYGIPLWLVITYLSSNLTLNSLNFFWFGKMIETVMKRFRVPAPGAETKVKAEEQIAKIKREISDNSDAVLEAAAKLEEQERLFNNGGMLEYSDGEKMTVRASTATAPAPSARRRKA